MMKLFLGSPPPSTRIIKSKLVVGILRPSIQTSKWFTSSGEEAPVRSPWGCYRFFHSSIHDHRQQGVDTGRTGDEERTDKRFKWFGIPLGLGITCLAALQLLRTLRRERKHGSDEVITWQLAMFRLLPARPLSRAWGWMHSFALPVWMRKPALGLFAWSFGCNMKEAQVEDLSKYQSLMQLFTRHLKHGARSISFEHELVSPSDGKILHLGRIEADGTLEQVKGVTYKLQQFLGPVEYTTDGNTREVSNLRLQEDVQQYSTDIKTLSSQACNVDKKTLYHVIIYLAPGDYHHFHSPADWNITLRRHFPGELLTVAPWAVKTMPGLFSLNERVILTGQWKYGFFGFAAVGAFNVGSIKMAVDKDLHTNIKGRYTMGEYTDRQLELDVKKGDRVGHFALGSSIVLVFEAPENFKILVEPGQTVKFGQPLGILNDAQVTD